MSFYRIFSRSVRYPWLIWHVSALTGFLIAPSQAQITLDGTLGSKGNLSGPNYTIGADVGKQVGGNLFHSFGEFNVHTGESATFTGPNTIENVIGRVTGGQLSEIDGPLRSEIPNANLYLLNPAGVLFGPNASLDVPGSFHVSTADSLKLADGGHFDATQSESSVLTSAPPTAFGFLGPNSAPITIQGSTLAVNDGQTLSVVGGRLTVEGSTATSEQAPSLGAPSGRVNLLSVASEGDVTLASTSLPSMEHFTALGEINVLQGAQITTSGDGGGSIVIRGGQLIVDNASVTANTLGSVDGGGIDIRLTGDLDQKGGQIQAATLSDGWGGGIRIETGQLNLTDGAQIFSGSGGFNPVTGEVTVGKGAGGNLVVKASESVSLSGEDTNGFPTGLFTRTIGEGSAGNLQIETKHLTLTDGAQIFSGSTDKGTGGNLVVRSSESINLSGESSRGTLTGLFASTSGEGAAGNLQVETKQLALSDGARIFSGSSGTGRGGNLAVYATESVNLSGECSTGCPSLLSTSTSGDGSAGELRVETKQLTLTGGAQLFSGSGSINPVTGQVFVGSGAGGNLVVKASESISLSGESRKGVPSLLTTSTIGDGSAGELRVETKQLTLTDGAQIFSGSGGFNSVTGEVTVGKGTGGNLVVKASESVSLSGESSRSIPSLLSTSTSGDGPAGELRVETKQLTLTNGAQIISGSGTFNPVTGVVTAGTGAGGNLVVKASESVNLSGESRTGFTSGLFSATFGDGRAGDLQLETGRLIATKGGSIATTNGSIDPITGDLRGGRGESGNLVVHATESIQLSGRSQTSPLFSGLFTNTYGDGSAGKMQVETGKLTITDGATIASTSGAVNLITGEVSIGKGVGGDLLVKATESIHLSGQDQTGFPSSILTLTGGDGPAGELRVETGQLSVTDRARISSASGFINPVTGATIEIA